MQLTEQITCSPVVMVLSCSAPSITFILGDYNKRCFPVHGGVEICPAMGSLKLLQNDDKQSTIAVYLRDALVGKGEVGATLATHHHHRGRQILSNDDSHPEKSSTGAGLILGLESRTVGSRPISFG